jgi:nitrous oxidase accessory protein NosD
MLNKSEDFPRDRDDFRGGGGRGDWGRDGVYKDWDRDNSYKENSYKDASYKDTSYKDNSYKDNGYKENSFKETGYKDRDWDAGNRDRENRDRGEKISAVISIPDNRIPARIIGSAGNVIKVMSHIPSRDQPWPFENQFVRNLCSEFLIRSSRIC